MNKIITIIILSINISGYIFAQEKTDYTSKAPEYSYPETYEAQVEALKTNSIVLKAKEYRKEFADDPHHPIYHFTSPEGKLNDPNGLSFWKGKWTSTPWRS
jgi:beta-fructofuranosidase